MKNKYKLLLTVSIILTYGALSYFTKAGLPIKCLLTFIYSLVFLKDERSCSDNLYISIPSFTLGYILSNTFGDINSEWFLFLGFLVYFLMVYLYSYMLKALKNTIRKLV